MDARDDFAEHDRALRTWFAARGWPVTETFDRVNAGMRAWSHSGARGRHTLYVTREVLDRNDPRVLPRLLEERFAAEALRDLPAGEAVLLCYRERLLVIRYFEGGED